MTNSETSGGGRRILNWKRNTDEKAMDTNEDVTIIHHDNYIDYGKIIKCIVPGTYAYEKIERMVMLMRTDNIYVTIEYRIRQRSEQVRQSK